MIRILYIPLDERPCNRKFPVEQFPPEERCGFEIITPPMALLGRKKEAAPFDALWQWFCEKIRLCDRAVISLEMMLYGGLLPSRIHNLDEEALMHRLSELERVLKQVKIPVYAFNLIMRTPRYNSSDEEPDYWEWWGARIYRRSELLNRKIAGSAGAEELAELEALSRQIPREYLQDYEIRRALNKKITFRIIDLYRKGIIDYLVIPQDDNSELGYSNMDRKEILGEEGHPVMYPGADEVGGSLLSRAALDSKNGDVKRKVYVLYDRDEGRIMVPNYEGMPLEMSLGYQIENCGGRMVSTPEEADLILAVQTTDQERREAWKQENRGDEENLQESFVGRMENLFDKGKAVALADVRYSNGGDFFLAGKMAKVGIFSWLKAYGAWNTSGNTIGSVLSRALIEINWPDEFTRTGNLKLHFIDDLLYQAFVRREIMTKYLSNADLDYFDLGDKAEEMSRLVKKLMAWKLDSIGISPPGDFSEVIISFPWNRLFEIEVG